MVLAKLLWQHARSLLVLSWLSAVATSVLTILLVSVIVAGIREQADPVPLWQYMLVGGLVLIAQITSMSSINNATYRAVHLIRNRLISSVVGASVASFERIGMAAVHSAFSDHTLRIIQGLVAIISLARDISFVVTIMAYLIWLSPLMAALVFGVLVAGYILMSPFQRVAVNRAMEHSRHLMQTMRVLRNLLDGLKQVKLTGTTSPPIVERAREVEHELNAAGKSMSWYFSLAMAGSTLLYIALLGIVAYLPVSVPGDATLIPAFLLSIVLLIQPIVGLSAATQTINLGKVSLARVTEMQAELAGAGPGQLTGAALALEEPASNVAASGTAVALQAAELEPRQLRKLSIAAIGYKYDNEAHAEFAVGPITVDASPGELIFVVGGNGSGKTTFAKLLTGLYEPSGGSITLNGQPVDAGNRAWYRQHFGCVFSDFCLFDGLAGSRFDFPTEEVADLIQRLQLSKVLRPGDTVFNAAAACSAGERRRLALLLALRENKPIMVLDEFAADQDPECKEMFYLALLPELKRQGKLVFVITHDNRYFDVADRILRLERGQSATLRPGKSAGGDFGSRRDGATERLVPAMAAVEPA